MKKFVSFILAFMLLSATAGAVDLYIDDELIDTDTPPTIVDGRTLVPLRAIFEAIGATVEWDNDTRTATGTKGETVVVIQIDNTTAYVNGEAHTLDVPAQLINSRTMVPARFISEAMGCEVTWYQNTQTAAVANELKGQKFYVTETGERYHYSSTCNGGTYYEATLAEARGRGLTPCEKCVLTEGNTSTPSTTPSGNSDANNFNSYDNVEQQQTDTTQQPSTTAPQSRTVYVTKTGKRYHYSNTCNGGTYSPSTLEEALKRGLTPCNKCVG